MQKATEDVIFMGRAGLKARVPLGNIRIFERRVREAFPSNSMRSVEARSILVNFAHRSTETHDLVLVAVYLEDKEHLRDLMGTFINEGLIEGELEPG